MEAKDATEVSSDADSNSSSKPYVSTEVPHQELEKEEPTRKAIADSSLLRIPNKLDFNETTELVNGTFKVSGREIDYFLEDGTHLLQARKKRFSRVYTIYDMTKKKGPIEIAEFSKAWASKAAIAYRMCVGQTNVDIACILFKKHGVVQKVMEDPSRDLTLVVSVTRDSGLPKSSSIVMDSQRYYGERDALKNKMDRPLQLVQVFPTKNPYNGNTGEFVLWFKGRGKTASMKNVQLIDSLDRVTWQMAQVSRSEYHVDFRAPLNPLQAFAAALGQHDL